MRRGIFFIILGLARELTCLLFQWLQLIIANRPHYAEENLDSMRSINDVRNGISAADDIRNQYFDARSVVVLKVCPFSSMIMSSLYTTLDTKSYP